MKALTKVEHSGTGSVAAGDAAQVNEFIAGVASDFLGKFMKNLGDNWETISITICNEGNNYNSVIDLVIRRKIINQSSIDSY